MSKKDDQYDDDEAKRRAEQALRGAFKTPPIEKKGADNKKAKSNERK